MYIYFIRAGDAIKVGVTTDVAKRMMAIQVGNPHKILLLHSINLSKKHVREIESEIKTIFHKTVLNGEWFQANQCIIDFIANIKTYGWETHVEWIEKQYRQTYGDILISLKNKIEQDIIVNNMVSLEKLKEDLVELFGEVYSISPLPENTAHDIRKWIEKRKDPFIPSDISSELRISTKKGKHNVMINLKRLTLDGTLERSGKPNKCIYKKK